MPRPSLGKSADPPDLGGPEVSVERLVDDALKSFDLEGSIGLLTGGQYWRTRPSGVAGLREIAFSDGAAGVRGEGWDAGDQSVCFPSPAALGATWDEPLVSRLAGLVAHITIEVMLAPTPGQVRPATGSLRCALYGRLRFAPSPRRYAGACLPRCGSSACY